MLDEEIIITEEEMQTDTQTDTETGTTEVIFSDEAIEQLQPMYTAQCLSVMLLIALLGVVMWKK